MERTRALAASRANTQIFVNLDAITYWSLLGQVDAMVGNSSSGIMEELPSPSLSLMWASANKAASAPATSSTSPPKHQPSSPALKSALTPGIPQRTPRHDQPLRQRNRGDNYRTRSRYSFWKMF